MPSSYTNLHYHIIFSTKERRPLIDKSLQARLYEYIGGIVTNEGAILRTIGGVADHVHLLAGVPPTLAIADFLRVVKSNSSKWVRETHSSVPFGWQDGYGAFSVSKSALDDVSAYIRTQEEHHRKMTFEEEFVGFLRRHEIAFDERYLWK